MVEDSVLRRRAQDAVRRLTGKGPLSLHVHEFRLLNQEVIRELVETLTRERLSKPTAASLCIVPFVATCQHRGAWTTAARGGIGWLLAAADLWYPSGLIETDEDTA